MNKQMPEAAKPDSSAQAQEHEKARAYNRVKRVLFLVELGAGLLYLLILLFSGLSFFLARSLESAVGNIWLEIPLYLLVVGLAYDLLTAPLALYSGFIVEHKYEQSTQSFGAWIWDQFKSKAVGYVIGIPLIEALYWLLRSYPQTWWVIATVMFVVVAVIMANLAPLVLMPLFYKFVPLRDEELKRRLIELCERVNTKVRGVYEMDMSRKTRAANAALVGLGNTRRIVLGDTLLERYEPDEIEAVLAHELGHHKNWDLWKGMFFQTAISALGFYVAFLALGRLAEYFGFRSPSDLAGFPLLALTIAGVSLLFLPASNAFSRRLERRADEFALRQTNNPRAFVSMMRKLGRQNLSEFDPNPFIEFVLFSHPSIGKRINKARQMFPESFERPEKA